MLLRAITVKNSKSFLFKSLHTKNPNLLTPGCLNF